MKNYIFLLLLFCSYNLFGQEPTSAYDNLLDLGHNFIFEEEDYQSANQVLTQAINMNPDISEAYFYRALGYRLGLDFEDANIDSTYNCLDLALIDLDRALILSPKDEVEFLGEIFSEIGIIQLLKDEGDYCSSFKKACEYKESNACDAYENLCK